MLERDDPFFRPADRWLARAISLGLHALLLAFLVRSLQQAVTSSRMVIFSVETVSGITPLGEGSGAEGANSQMSNTPANANPLAGGLHLKVTDAPVPPSPKGAAKAPVKVKAVAAPPSLQDLSKKYESLDIGLKPRRSDGAEEPSEGGMGNARQAGTADGLLGLEGAIAGRRYIVPELNFGKPLPGESEVLIQLTVAPQGEVLSAQVKRTSGYPELDLFTLSKAREIKFDALPPNVPQEIVSGTVLLKFQYTGEAKR